MEPDVYEIRVRGRLDARRAVWFDGMTIHYDTNGDTLLVGPVTDQASLHGLLGRIRDLGLMLIAVNRIESGL